MTKPDTPAFPALGYEYSGAGDLRPTPTMHTGMTLRDWFAGQAMMAIYFLQQPLHGDTTPEQRQALAQRCYDIAEAMLAESQRRGTT